MKRTFFIVALVLITSTATYAQFKFGLGVSVGTEAGLINGVGLNYFEEHRAYPGINLRGNFQFPIMFGVQGGITYFLPTTFTYGVAQDITITNMQANIDLVYYFIKTRYLKVYALGGPTLSYLKVKQKGNFAGTGKDEYYEPSFELGAGAIFGRLFLEAKYDFSKMNHFFQYTDYEIRGSQFIGTFGIYF